MNTNKSASGLSFKKQLQQKVLSAWYKPVSWTLLLIPLSWLFQIIGRIRRCILTAKQKKYSVPVIVIGNITIGGSGKTPLVIHLAKRFSEMGCHVGIVSRGYGRIKSDSLTVVTPENSACDVGDEPMIISRQTNCPVIVGPDRSSCVDTLLQYFPKTQVILSDDGLQHYKMSRDIEIAVINGNKRLGNGFCLPAGPLREPASRLNHVDYIIASHKAIANEFLLSYHPKYFVNLDSKITPISVTQHRFVKVHAVAGIGEPASFFSLLENNGIEIIRHPFPDHYLYNPADLNFGDDFPIIMTEKDAVKCKNFKIPNAWFLSIETHLPEEFERIITERLKGLLYGKETI